jgi:hypothetical protein
MKQDSWAGLAETEAERRTLAAGGQSWRLHPCTTRPAPRPHIPRTRRRAISSRISIDRPRRRTRQRPAVSGLASRNTLASTVTRARTCCPNRSNAAATTALAPATIEQYASSVISLDVLVGFERASDYLPSTTFSLSIHLLLESLVFFHPPLPSPCIYTPRARHTRQGTASPADFFSSSPSCQLLISSPAAPVATPLQRLASSIGCSSRRLSASRWQVASRRLQRRRRRWRHRSEAADGGSTGRPSTAESPTCSWSPRSSPPTRSTRALVSSARQNIAHGEERLQFSPEFPWLQTPLPILLWRLRRPCSRVLISHLRNWFLCYLVCILLPT